MSDGGDPLFETVRAACPPQVWSRGVELSRAASIRREASDDDEILLRVTTRSGMTSPRVSLFVDDLEWECECAAATEACEHVAAAVIVLRRGREQGVDVAAPGPAAASLRYALSRATGGLALERLLVRQGEAPQPFTASIAAARRGTAGPALSATQADLALELALGARHRGPIPRAKALRVCRALARCDDVRYAGRPVEVAAEPLLPRIVVEEVGEGFRLTLHDDSELEETFDNGMVLCGGRLQALGESGLTAVERDRYRAGTYFASDQVDPLVTEVLPALRERLPVELRTARLPDTERVPPRLQVESARDGERLRVTVWIVYGEPPRGRVEGEHLVHLSGKAPLRDTAAEKRLARRLQQAAGLTPGIPETFDGPAAVGLLERLDVLDAERVGSGAGFFARAPALTADFRPLPGDFEIAFRSQGAGETFGSADPARVLAAWRSGESLVPLLEGGWAPLPADWLARYGERLTDLLAAREAGRGLPAAALPDLLALCDELELPDPPALADVRAALDGFERLPEATLPDDLSATLRGYQRAGVAWLQFLRGRGWGGLLADDMGLGKTLQALCAIPPGTLVVAPTSVLPNWAAEIRRFRPSLDVCVYHGPRRALEEADVTLTTYGLLRQDRELLAQRRWAAAVLDEAQAIKNPDSRVARAAFALDAGWRLTLTGTPVENRLDELWSQLHFVNPGALGSREDFAARYGEPIAAGEPGVAERLRRRIRPFVLRRLKGEVAPELPPRTDVVLHCELDAGEREIYEAIRAATLREVVGKLQGGGNVLAALEALLRLRQAACHGGLIPGQQAERSSKVALLLETLDTVVAEGHKALVFSQWTGLLDLVEPHLHKAGIPFVRLDGSTRDRGGVVERFQGDAQLPLMLISLKAGGTGLNLTAADHVFILDPWWNPAVEDQAADRAHRIGQDKPVLVYRLVAEETVEERILALQEHKRELARAALAGADRAQSLTRDDLLALLE